MEKVLKKYTTIPQPLYVDRYADIQLKRIIEEMQRPGYVLVARQMGKTNLLFNAKRTLENDNRLFAYVDLSNLYTNERDCYRNIINSIIEPNLPVFESIELDIEKIREKDLPPHNEYSRSLIKILNHFQGDLVIILDEIDALKSVSYSDNIFAQIRSNYFSRTNYPVLERLTYVLSGVIEPTELIKDKNKSPFNIGDKIYLDDFTKEEHNNFIEKSRLQISEAFADEIFGWTNGNPRLTFDVCAEVENYLINKGEINSEILKNIITRKYLTSFDVAPIDHIRELAKSNKQVRDAISLINKKESNKISDEIKKRLYLFGIINSKFNDEITIKNRIIRECLTEDWIKSIEKLSKDDFSYGLEKIDSKDYAEAINSLTDYLNNSEPTKSQTEISYYNIGFAYYKLDKLNEAIEYFSKDFSINLYSNNSKSFLGICHIANGNIERGKDILEKVIENQGNDFGYRNALLNLASLVSNEQKELALKLYDDLIRSIDNPKDEVKQSELIKIKTLALFNQANIYFILGDKQNAIEKIKLALNFSENSDSLHLIYSLYSLQENKDENLKSLLVNKIVENNLIFENEISSTISFKEIHLLNYLNFVFATDVEIELFNQLLDYSISVIYKQSKSKFELIYEVSSISKTKVVQILKYLLNFEEELSIKLLIDVFSDLAYHYSENQSDYSTYFNKYLQLFNNKEKIDKRDIYLFAIGIKYYSDTNETTKALILCGIIDKKIIESDDDELKFESLIIYYWYSNLYFTLRDNDNAKYYADETLKLINIPVKDKFSVIDEKGLESISNQMKQIKNSSIIRNPIISSKKYERNTRVKVKYKNGNVKEDKYKRLEADILAERCFLIE